MTIKDFRSNLIAVTGQATTEKSATNPRYSKNEIWNRLLRQCSKEGKGITLPKENDLIHTMYVDTFNREFTLPVEQAGKELEEKLSKFR